MFAIATAGALALSALALIPTHPETSDVGEMTLWEAYARGLVSIRMEDRTYQRGEDTVTLPVGIRVDNAATVPVAVGEEAMLMSPHPSEPPGELETTQDGVLTTGTVPAGGSLTYFFGEEVLLGYLPEPFWWCTEEFQFTRSETAFRLGGETLPFALREVLADPHSDGPESNTQSDLWAALRNGPAVVVGKEPLWMSLDASGGEHVEVILYATNLAVYTFDDEVLADANLTGGALEDEVPAGWVVEEGSYSRAPDEIEPHEDGSTTLRWFLDLPAALESEAENPLEPTLYTTAQISYVLVSPALPVGRAELPRARSDMDRDGVPDAHSALVALDVVSTNAPPHADAGGPYAGTEGGEILLSAAASSDPDGDALQFRWDFMDDGSFDTDWSGSPEAVARYLDDFRGFARVEVTDGTMTGSATAEVVIGNAAPQVRSLDVWTGASFRLAVAGERWHDVVLTVTSNGSVLAEVAVVREPGSPWGQAAETGFLSLDLAAGIDATLVYTPQDDRVNGNPNGDNPVFLEVARTDGSEIRLSHNFNGRHPATWTWTVSDLGPFLASGGVVFEAVLQDAGADPLTATWDFDDGSVVSEAYPSDGSAPHVVTVQVLHAFPDGGTYQVRLTVEDDDGGVAEASITLRL